MRIVKRTLSAIVSFLALTSLVVLVGCKCPPENQPDPDDPTPVVPDTPGDSDDEDDPATETKTPDFYDLVGVDHFGRTFGTISSLKKDRQVGIFYWPWIGQPYASDIYDATKIAALPNGINILTNFDYLDETISPNGQAHYWGEPLWGYYNSEDEWVTRKQMAMLTAAGVDFVFFDMTNAVIYEPVFKKVCAVISEMMAKGWDAPQIVFYTHSRSLDTIRNLYNALYKPNLYPETWYRIDGKPVIIGYTDAKDDLAEAASRGDNSYSPAPLSSEILSFFH
ncbi:MAG: hypothetical protein HUJ91_00805, partial [Bacteroidales bacterium]|nr:hypothetical protein [Bacteroidales bacterium]